MYTLDEFCKVASEYMDTKDIPQHVMKAAHRIHDGLPVNSAHIVLAAHDAVEDENAKLAFEVVGAALIKQANPLAMLGGVARSAVSAVGTGAANLAKNVGFHGAMAAPTMYSKLTDKTNTLAQGSVLERIPNGVIN